MEQNNVIEIQNLTKRYGSNKAVNNISFEVKHGEILGFLGPNGAGKTTTMNIPVSYTHLRIVRALPKIRHLSRAPEIHYHGGNGRRREN